MGCHGNFAMHMRLPTMYFHIRIEWAAQWKTQWAAHYFQVWKQWAAHWADIILSLHRY